MASARRRVISNYAAKNKLLAANRKFNFYKLLYAANNETETRTIFFFFNIEAEMISLTGEFKILR